MVSLINQRFNSLVVESLAERNKHNQIMWKCRCDCGNITEATTSQLRLNKKKSCGCLKAHKSTNNLVGSKFTRLTPIRIVGKDKSRANIWECRCDCGNITNVSSTALKSGHTKSCGCLLKEYINSSIVDYTDFEDDNIKVLARLSTLAKSVPYICLCKHCGNEFIVTDHALRQMCVKSCGCTYGSKLEQEIVDYIKDLVPNINIRRQEKIGNSNFEMDIYLPTFNIGIEINGSFTHATLGSKYSSKPSDYHQKKFLLAKENGIRLISIFDVFWGDRLKLFLKDLLLPKHNIYARKCSVGIVSRLEAKEFLNKYHIQGFNNNSKYNYGLYYNGELVSLASFGTVRYHSGVELIRYAVKSGICVTGGINKLFKHFISDINPVSILSYSDNNYFLGNAYEKLGFSFVKYTKPDYYWCIHGKYYSRESCQPKKLMAEFSDLYDSSASSIENDIMLKRGAYKVYRCGNTRWELKLRDN